MDAVAIDRLWTRLASGQRARGIAPFVEAPVNVWARIDKNGACTGGVFNTRAQAREARHWSMVEGCRVVKTQSLRWFGQPMRVKDGPVVRRVRDLSKHTAGTVYRVGRGRQPFDVLITDIAPIVTPRSLTQTLFKGVLCPFTHARAIAPRKTRH